MKKLTKALQGTIKRLEVKSVTQLMEIATDKLNKDLKDLNKCYDYDMTEEQNEIVEVLIQDLNSVLKDRLTNEILLVADKKETKGDKPKAPKKTAKKDSTNKKQTTADKKSIKKQTLKDVLKWKSLIKMTLEDNIHYCYVTDIEKDFQDVLCRSTDINTLVFQFDSETLQKGLYTDPTGDTWKLEYTGQELK